MKDGFVTMVNNDEKQASISLQAICQILNGSGPVTQFLRLRVEKWLQAPSLQAMAMGGDDFLNIKPMPQLIGRRMVWVPFLFPENATGHDRPPFLEAKQLFGWLITNPRADWLHKCARCGRFFVGLRATHTRYCSLACARSGSARDSQRRIAGQEKDELLGLAVKFWPQWTERKHPNRALWIAMQMNAKRKGTERRITQKWVSRNIDIKTGKAKENAKS